MLVSFLWQVGQDSYALSLGNLVMAQGGDRRRHPQNLQGVLRLAVEAGSASEGPTPNEPMSEEVNERLTFLGPFLCLPHFWFICTASLFRLELR